MPARGDRRGGGGSGGNDQVMVAKTKRRKNKKDSFRSSATPAGTPTPSPFATAPAPAPAGNSAVGPPRSTSGSKDNVSGNKQRRRTPPTSAHQHQKPSQQTSQSRRPSINSTNAAIRSSGARGSSTPRAKERPARFTHPQLEAELRRLRRPWLSPGDPLFEAALERSYRGMRRLPCDELPRALHSGFRGCFEGLHDAGLFLYDTVQAGGKRLSRTFVTRTLVGDPGITYKYLGLRLFAHPWDRDGDFRVGPGDGLADALNDSCLADLFRLDGESGGGSANHDDHTSVGETLRNVRHLSHWMRSRAVGLLEQEGKGTGSGAAGGAGGAREAGSCDFNLTLINRMESAATKRDLKPDPLFAMGKCSVSWHADSCLEDFSTIGVYHCTDPVPTEPDWGIALRVSKEAEGGGGSGGGKSVPDSSTAKRKREGKQESSSLPVDAEAAGELEEVITPPLLVPLQSGDAYFLLDDFNHFHEHAVVSGSSTLRYSSTHRVAATEGNTFSHIQRRCEDVLAGGGGCTGGANATEPRQVLDVAQVRAEQALLSELETEWLNQFWVQGRRHATLHPWWRGPMALVLATWRELDRRTAVTARRLLALGRRRSSAEPKGAPGSPEPTAVCVSRAFDTVLRALEERRESRSRWDLRFADSAYRSLSRDCSPVVPALWSRGNAATETSGCGEGRDSAAWEVDGPLPKALAAVIARLRDCYTEAYRTACGGKKAGSAKAIAAGAASNWELFQAAPHGGDSGPPRQSVARVGGDDGSAGPGGGRRRAREGAYESGGRGGGGGRRGRRKKGKGPKKNKTVINKQIPR